MSGRPPDAQGDEPRRELRATVPDQLPDVLRRAHPDRLPPTHPRHEEITAAHERALDRDDPGYIDPRTGLFVLTAAALWERGWCCGQGCRHCPYVDLPRRLEEA